MARLLSIGKIVNTLDVIIAGIAIRNRADKIVSGIGTSWKSQR